MFEKRNFFVEGAGWGSGGCSTKGESRDHTQAEISLAEGGQVYFLRNKEMTQFKCQVVAPIFEMWFLIKPLDRNGQVNIQVRFLMEAIDVYRQVRLLVPGEIDLFFNFFFWPF